MPIRTVCFDLGGVVVRICRSFVEAAAAAQLPLLDAAHLLEPDAVARRREVMEAHQVGDLDMAQYCERMSEAIFGLYRPEQVRALHAAWPLGEYPGVRELMQSLRALPDVRLACLSNTNDAHWEQMLGSPDVYPSLTLLHTQMASHQMRLAKPDPAIYAAACAEFDCAPGEILFFDDLAENVEAACASGWHAERIDPSGDTAAQLRAYLAAHGVLPLGASAPAERAQPPQAD